MSTKSCKFNLKKLSKEKIMDGFKNIKKKKSSGSDGLTQEQLSEGLNWLVKITWVKLLHIYLEIF